MNKLNRFLAVSAILSLFSFAHADHHLQPVSLKGEWKVVANAEDAQRELTWTFKEDGKQLSGVSLDAESLDERDFDRITIKEKKVTLETDIEADGRSGKIVVNGEEKSFGKLSGKWSIVGDDGVEYMSGEFSALKEFAFAGVWDAVSILPSGEEVEHALQLDGKNSKLKGFIEGPHGKWDVTDAKIKDGAIGFEFSFTMDGNTMDGTIKASPKSENQLVGEWSVESPDGEMSGEWNAKRKQKNIAGTWNTVAVVPDYGDYDATLTLKRNNDKYVGKTAGQDGDTTELEKIDFDGEQLVVSFPFDRDGITGTIKIEAKLQKDGNLKGEWSLTSDGGQEFMRGEWRASAQK